MFMNGACLMARHSWLTLMLLLIWRERAHCAGFTVDPPEDLVISDPGHLGRLQMTWSPPAGRMNLTQCSRLYQLEYYDTYTDSWTAIRTAGTTHNAQFDLMKDVSVRVYTLLTGPCTNGTIIKSASYTELVQKPTRTGVVGTEVQDFVCVYYNMKYVECTWGGNPKMPANSQRNLYFWHKDLGNAEECPKYLITGGIRSGCNFTEKSLPEFTDINFCVNGSSPDGPLKPTFVSLQIQDYVRPDTTQKVDLKTGPGVQLEVHWQGPAGRVPGHCLEWEVEHIQEGPDGKITSKRISTKQTSLTLAAAHDGERHCLRVRSKLHKYCVKKSFWSDWSHPTCHPEMREVSTQPGWDKIPIYEYVTVAFISILVLLLCGGQCS